MWPAIIGGALSAAGSILGKPDGPPSFSPWNVTAPGVGWATFNKKTKTATGELDPRTIALMNQLYGTATGPGYGAGAAMFGQSMMPMMPGLFSDAQAASYMDPRMMNQFNNSLNASMGMQQAGIGSLFGYGNQMMGGQGPGMSQARRMFSEGRGMLGERPEQSYQDVAQGRVDLLREQAAPFENRAQNAMFDKLNKMGQMGMPAGMRNMEAFAGELGRADLARQMEGQNLAESLYGRDLQYSLGRNQIGAGMMGQGMGGMLQGMGLGLDAYQSGVNAIPNLANMANMKFGGNMMFSDAINARAQQRMGNAVNMFGFGSDAQSQDLQQALAAMGGYQNLQGGQLDLMRLGAQLGGQQAAAGAAYGPQSNPWGSLAQGIGYGMMNNPNLFGGGSGMSYNPVYSGGGVPMIAQPTSPIKIDSPLGGIQFGNLLGN
jgi:hypothetical protein